MYYWIYKLMKNGEFLKKLIILYFLSSKMEKYLIILRTKWIYGMMNRLEIIGVYKDYTVNYILIIIHIILF